MFLGTMICCYLLYSGLQITAEDALACYDEKRTKDRKGVTIPSQRRYVQYFAKLIRSGLQYEKKTLQFCEIRFLDGDFLHSHGIVTCIISELKENPLSKIQILQTFNMDFRKNFTLEINNPYLWVTGDIKVELTHKTSRKKIFHFWFNTYFVCDTADVEEDNDCRKLVYTLCKSEIDEVHKDKEHKYFPENFKVQVVFLLLNCNESRNADINSTEPKEEKLHNNISNNISPNKLHVSMPQNTSKNCELNSSVSARFINKNMSKKFLIIGSEGEEVSFNYHNTYAMKGVTRMILAANETKHKKCIPICKQLKNFLPSPSSNSLRINTTEYTDGKILVKFSNEICKSVLNKCNCKNKISNLISGFGGYERLSKFSQTIVDYETFYICFAFNMNTKNLNSYISSVGSSYSKNKNLHDANGYSKSGLKYCITLRTAMKNADLECMDQEKKYL